MTYISQSESCLCFGHNIEQISCPIEGEDYYVSWILESVSCKMWVCESENVRKYESMRWWVA